MSLTAPFPETGDAWVALTAQLDALAAAGRSVAFWWRDDDATEPSPALDRLLGLADRHRLPLALAVIPAGAGPALADRVRACGTAWVLQHGWSHANHAADEAKSIELGGNRPAQDVTAELAMGRERLESLFAERFVPVLVPPWNRIDPDLLPAVAAMGYPVVSVDGEGDGQAVPRKVNVHLDPIDWNNGRRFAGEDALIRACGRAVHRRHEGPGDREEPVGIMTHHWVHDDALWAVLDRLLGTLAGHAAVRWPGPHELFGIGGR